MKRLIQQLALAAPLLLPAGAALAAVQVTYVQPEKFTDLPAISWQRQQALDDFSDHFKELARTLPPGQDLKIDVLDIDLAGREQPSGLSTDPIRIRRGAGDWPRMHLRYALTQQGTVIKSGDAQLSDRAYMRHINMYPEDERWPFEKQMIDDWWQKTIGPIPK